MVNINKKTFEIFELIKYQELSFFILQRAINNKIGVNLGGNVFELCLDRFRYITQSINFELIDNPMDINAEILFSGDNVKTFACVNKY